MVAYVFLIADDICQNWQYRMYWNHNVQYGLRLGNPPRPDTVLVRLV